MHLDAWKTPEIAKNQQKMNQKKSKSHTILNGWAMGMLAHLYPGVFPNLVVKQDHTRSMEGIPSIDYVWVCSHGHWSRFMSLPVTRPNGYRNVTGEILMTRTRTRQPRTRKPARVSIPIGEFIFHLGFTGSVFVRAIPVVRWVTQ